MNCNKCGAIIPQKRVDLGYKECVNCSSTQRWTVVPVNYHKTGNTTEIIKDPEVAADFLHASKRKGFGVLTGMTTNRKRVNTEILETNKSVKISTVVNDKVISRRKLENEFDKVGEEMMSILESGSNKSLAISHIEKAFSEKRIFRIHKEQLLGILNKIS